MTSSKHSSKDFEVRLPWGAAFSHYTISGVLPIVPVDNWDMGTKDTCAVLFAEISTLR